MSARLDFFFTMFGVVSFLSNFTQMTFSSLFHLMKRI